MSWHVHAKKLWIQFAEDVLSTWIIWWLIGYMLEFECKEILFKCHVLKMQLMLRLKGAGWLQTLRACSHSELDAEGTSFNIKVWQGFNVRTMLRCVIFRWSEQMTASSTSLCREGLWRQTKRLPEASVKDMKVTHQNVFMWWAVMRTGKNRGTGKSYYSLQYPSTLNRTC